MRKVILFTLCLLFFKISYSLGPDESTKSAFLKTTNTETLTKNYQNFKFQVVNLETKNLSDYTSLIKKRRKKNDDLMLYVAGGIAVATITLILANNPENFTSNSASGVNLGIAVGGTVASGMIVAKYFIDKKRR